MRFRVAVVVVLLGVFALVPLVGCTNTGESYTPETPTPLISTPTIAEEGVLRVGVNAERSPLAGMNSDKTRIVGIDVDVAASLADALGLKVSIVDVGSDAASALSEGSVDVVLGIDKNTQTSSFWKSEAYLPTGVALFAASENAVVPTAASGAKFAAQVSSTSAWAVMNEFGDTSLTSTSNLAEAFSALESGTVQYVAADAVIGAFYASSTGSSASLIALMQQPSGYCVGVSDSNTELKTIISDAISTLTSNGVIDIIETKWLGETMDIDALPLTAGATKSTTSSSSDDDIMTDSTSSSDAATSSSDSASSGVSNAGANAVTTSSTTTSSTTTSSTTTSSTTTSSTTTSN